MKINNKLKLSTQHKMINNDHLFYSYKKFISYNSIYNNILKISKINQSFNENDSEDKLINTDYSQETIKMKNIYKKKLNLSKIKSKNFNQKNYFYKNYNLNVEESKLKEKKKFSLFANSFKNLENIRKNRIKSNFNLENDNKIITINIDMSKIQETDNNFYKKDDNNNNFEKEKNKKEMINNDSNNNISNINDEDINDDINIEELILIEEKYNNLIKSINKKLIISNECLELIDCLYNSTLCNKFGIYFKKNQKIQLIIYKSIILMIYNSILAYHISLDDSFFYTCLDYLAIIININHKSYLLLCEYIANNFINDLNNNNSAKNLLSILKNNLTHIDINDKDFLKYLTSRKFIITKKNINFIYEIKFYSYLIEIYIKVLLKNINSNKKEELNKLFNDINNLTFQEVYIFFQQKIKNIEESNIKYKNILNKFTPTNPDIKTPFINSKLTKKFSLVLDLDETLISLDTDKNSNKAVIKFRPGLVQFLIEMKKFYEIIVFTSATKDYGDQIEDAIEGDKKIFDFRLYREHTISYNNEYIKDISRIGRPLNKILIVDNMPQNFRLQRENGIWIKSFFGDDPDDDALDYLEWILKKIVKEFDDVREGILKYKKEIQDNISESFY